MKKLMKHEVGNLTSGSYKTNTLKGVTYYELFNTLGQPTYNEASEEALINLIDRDVITSFKLNINL